MLELGKQQTAQLVCPAMRDQRTALPWSSPQETRADVNKPYTQPEAFFKHFVLLISHLEGNKWPVCRLLGLAVRLCRLNIMDNKTESHLEGRGEVALIFGQGMDLVNF